MLLLLLLLLQLLPSVHPSAHRRPHTHLQPKTSAPTSCNCSARHACDTDRLCLDNQPATTGGSSSPSNSSRLCTHHATHTRRFLSNDSNCICLPSTTRPSPAASYSLLCVRLFLPAKPAFSNECATAVTPPSDQVLETTITDSHNTSSVQIVVYNTQQDGA